MRYTQEGTLQSLGNVGKMLAKHCESLLAVWKKRPSSVKPARWISLCIKLANGMDLVGELLGEPDPSERDIEEERGQHRRKRGLGTRNEEPSRSQGKE